MKRIIALLLAMSLMLALAACGGSSEQTEPSISKEDKIRDNVETAVKAHASVHCLFTYDCKNPMAYVTTIDENRNGTYTVYGYVDVMDNYNEHYKGKFVATVELEFNGEAEVTDFDMDDPRKD